MKKEENINLLDIKERLNDYILTLKSKKIIVDNKDISKSGLAREETVSRAINGKKESLTKSLVKKILKEFGEHGFTLEYIWTGQRDEEVNSTENTQSKIEPDQKIDILLSQLADLKKDLSLQKKQNEKQAQAIIEFIEKERIAVSDLILDLKNTLVTKKENR